MHRKEINERSPLRVLEKSIHGGLGRGNLGVVVARHGVGKTALLVGIALDDLMRGRNVLHVSLDMPVEKVREFYEEIFQELVQERKMEDVWKVGVDVERHRRIHVYPHGTFSAERLAGTLAFMATHTDFRPFAIMVDEIDLAKLTRDDLQALRRIAVEYKAEVWMSVSTTRHSPRDGAGIPEPVAAISDQIDVILTMSHDGEGIHVSVLKDHDSDSVSDLALALDPTTMLLVREKAQDGG